MKRRSFLAMVGISPAVGPAVLTDMVSGQNLSGLGAQAAQSVMEDEDNYPDGCSENVSSDGDETSYLQRMIRNTLQEHRDRRNAPLTKYLRNVNRLDPDLQVNRSLSLTAKVRVQAERNREIDIQQDRKSTWDRIKHYRRRLSGKSDKESENSVFIRGVRYAK